MTERAGHEPSGAPFERIRRMVNERGVDIRLILGGSALRMEFADGQRILINFDQNTTNVWLAARSGGTEFLHRDGAWLAQGGDELFTRLREVMEQVIASNPVNARPAPAKVETRVRPAPLAEPEAKRSHGSRNVLIVLLAAAIGFWAAQRLDIRRGGAPASTDAHAGMVAPERAGARQQCDAAFPANGSVAVFQENGAHPGGANDAEIMLENDHAHPVLAILTAPHTVIPSMSVLVHARQNAAIRVPAGQYDLLFGVGTSWCNARIGFSDGTLMKFDKALTVEAGRPLHIGMQSSGASPEDFRVFVRTSNPEAEVPPPTVAGDGTIEVRRHANGHFYLPGTIENVPLTFLVDTGASVTSISTDVARQAGIRGCKEVQFQTANGTASGCLALVSRMTLGDFVLENITVAVMPSLETNLLGANALRNFHVSQSDSTMLVGRR